MHDVYHLIFNQNDYNSVISQQKRIQLIIGLLVYIVTLWNPPLATFYSVLSYETSRPRGVCFGSDQRVRLQWKACRYAVALYRPCESKNLRWHPEIPFPVFCSSLKNLFSMKLEVGTSFRVLYLLSEIVTNLWSVSQ